MHQQLYTARRLATRAAAAAQPPNGHPKQQQGVKDERTKMALAKSGTPYVPKEERDRRFKANLCISCGEPGHISPKCPHKPGPSNRR